MRVSVATGLGFVGHAAPPYVCAGLPAGRDLGRAAGRNGAVRSATQWRYYRAGDRGEPIRRPSSRIEHRRHERGGVGRKRIDEGNAA